MLSECFSFRCVYIPDRQERNRFEALLIATLAACDQCQPSRSWLGNFAYSEVVKRSGLWNSDYVGGPTLRDADVRRLATLIDASPRSPQKDLSDTLLLIPCSAGKDGAPDPGLPACTVADFLGQKTAAILEEGRALAFKKRGIHLDRRSVLRPALGLYSGYPYATEGFREQLDEALRRGLHCLIVSAGYGVVRPEEGIHRYNAQANQTRSVWHKRLPEILSDYVQRNGIKRTLFCGSSSYASLVPSHLSKENWRTVPRNAELGSGSALRAVPREVGRRLTGLLCNGLEPTKEWIRSSL
jgi:hypothetical protein